MTTLQDVFSAQERTDEVVRRYIRENVKTETLVGILLDRPECTTFHTTLADSGSGLTLNGTLYEGNLIALLIDRDRE